MGFHSSRTFSGLLGLYKIELSEAVCQCSYNVCKVFEMMQEEHPFHAIIDVTKKKRSRRVKEKEKDAERERGKIQFQHGLESSWHNIMCFTLCTLLILSLSHTHAHANSCSFPACPTSIKSTPKMIICLRQIILGKAIYRITIALLYPPSQTSSLECVRAYVCVCGPACVFVNSHRQCPAHLFLHANIHVYTHLSLSSNISAKSCACNLFSREHLHNCMVSLDLGSGSFSFQINKYAYPLLNLQIPMLIFNICRRIPFGDIC